MTFHQQEVLSPGREAAKERNGPLWDHGHTSSSGCSEALADLPGFRPWWALAGYCLLLLAGWGQHPSRQVSLAQCEAGHPC